ncbi:MAG: hypothetical protein KDJ50_11070, partial [Alphaproteobacteria bacterium]|nr:hypothetical protein [Alphaproteobacteria bacterium]
MTQKSSANLAPDTAIPHDENILKAAKLKKLAALEEKGINAFPHKFERTHKQSELQDKYADLESGAETEDTVHIAGRIMAMRNNGM